MARTIPRPMGFPRLTRLQSPSSLSLLLFLLLFLLLLASAPALAAPAPSAGAGRSLVCRAPDAAPPCGASASLGPALEPGLDPGIANPIQLATGEKYLREIDLPEPVDAGHPGFVRLYRSGSSQNSPLGRGWTSGYDVRLQVHHAGWQLSLPDGRRYQYDAQGLTQWPEAGHLILPAQAHTRIAAPAPAQRDAQAAVSAPPTAAQIAAQAAALAATTAPTKTATAARTSAAAATAAPTAAPTAMPTGTGPAWLGPTGQRLDFDTDGRLRRIHAPGLPDTLISYYAQGPLAGLMQAIHRGSGRLTLRYQLRDRKPLLRFLDTPAGTFQYDHDEDPARLRRVQRPDAMRRHYHYEASLQAGSPAALTGITLEDRAGQHWRARSWAYDHLGRVIRAVPGAPDQTAGRLDLSYTPRGQGAAGQAITRLRSASGQLDVTLGPRGQRAALMDARPARCSPCPPTVLPVRHDARGRLAALGELRILRQADGGIRQLRQEDGGWPGLQLDYDPQGRRSAWHSTLAGQTRLLLDAAGRPQGLRHANGNAVDIGLDTIGRPIQLHYAGSSGPAVDVRLQWKGSHAVRLEHPQETEYLAHDGAGRVRMRTIRRPHPQGTLQYQETFAYDAAGRLARHGLPEGGALHYQWAEDTRLAAITWEAADGTRHPVIRSEPGLAGYRYGNGLHLLTHADAAGRADALMLSQGDQLVWGEWRQHGPDGRVLRVRQTAPAIPHQRQRRYGYDDRGRLAALTDSLTGPAWFAWNDDGSLRARHVPRIEVPASAPAGTAAALAAMRLPAAAHAPASIARDAAGLPLTIGPLGLRYQAQQRLAEVRLGTQRLARYAYNARGHRIRQHSDTAETERYYVDNRLAAIWHRPAALLPSGPRFAVSQRYIRAHEVPVGLLQTDASGRTQLLFIHADLQGAPVLVTDDAGTVRWAASHDALGRATRLQGDLSLPLRWPGQDEDPATGWHENTFRTYLPDLGQYLEPDPLGPLPGQQALGYAAQQPMRHADPLGLILLAFDGTRYDGANQGNVWKFAQAYADGPAYYHAGPGSSRYLNWDAVTAASSGQILRNQWQSLLNALDRARGSAAPTPIDILGYSRGAALAREFANRIARQTRNGWFSYDDPLRGTIGLCVDLRFMGLFDTVAQFGLLGARNAGYDLAITDAWHWVAHAVALHELRIMYPLVTAGNGSAGNIVEAPFIGAHADIGGGLALDERRQPLPDGDLSDVALNWMRWQALAALVPMADLAADDQQVSRALLHDERSPMVRAVLSSDRDLQDPMTRSLGPQGADARLGKAQRQAVEAFIRRMEAGQGLPENVVGEVDMQAYGAWLETELGLPGMSGPSRQP